MNSRSARGHVVPRFSAHTLAALACCGFANLALVAQTNVGGAILSNTTWTRAGSPYVVTSSIIVGGGATLTIDPGVEVRVNDNLALSIGFSGLGAGTLIARGTAQQPIVMTRSTTTGRWTGIRFTDLAVDAVADAAGNYVSGSILEYCAVGYGGLNASGAVEVTDSVPYLSHVTVSDCNGVGIYASVSLPPTATLYISGCRVERAGTHGVLASVRRIVAIANEVYDCPNGSGLSLYAGDTLMNCSNNIVARCGRGLELGGSSSQLVAQVSSNSFLDNRGAGISLGTYVYGTWTVANNTVVGNRGSGIVCPATYPTLIQITGNTINKNGAVGVDGGGINAQSANYTLRITDNRISDNVARMGGGAFLTGNGGNPNVTFTSNTLAGNSAADGGGLYVGYGVAIAGNQLNNVFNTFLGNRATRGNDIYCGLSFGYNVNANYTCFAGPSRTSDPNQVWDFLDDASLGVVVLTNPVTCGPFADLGSALSGAGGAPRLDATGTLLPGSQVSWILSNAAPSAPGLFALAGASLHFPLFGGVIVPAIGPSSPTFNFVTDTNGGKTFSIGSIPALPRGTPLYSQMFVADAGAPAGIAFSNGNLGVVP